MSIRKMKPKSRYSRTFPNSGESTQDNFAYIARRTDWIFLADFFLSRQLLTITCTEKKHRKVKCSFITYLIL